LKRGLERERERNSIFEVFVWRLEERMPVDGG
jgi:hypothetical protein